MLSGILAYAGQFLAAYFWQGWYSLEYNLISDLGVTECMQIDDWLLVRNACSPGHGWFTWGFVLAGIALLCGAVLLAASGRDALGRRLQGTLAAGVPLLLAAVAMILVGAVSYDTQPQVHLVALAVMLLGFWVTMACSAWISFQSGRVPRTGEAKVPVLARTLLPLTLLLLVVSVVGLVLMLVSPSMGRVGLYMRIALDPVLLWMIAVGAAYLLGGSRRRRQARERERESREAEQVERDAALRKAGGQ